MLKFAKFPFFVVVVKTVEPKFVKWKSISNKLQFVMHGIVCKLFTTTTTKQRKDPLKGKQFTKYPSEVNKNTLQNF